MEAMDVVIRMRSNVVIRIQDTLKAAYRGSKECPYILGAPDNPQKRNELHLLSSSVSPPAPCSFPPRTGGQKTMLPSVAHVTCMSQVSARLGQKELI